MNIALLHYHLKPGGVTNVLKHQIRALSDRCKTVLLTGDPPDTPIHDRTLHIPGLGYSGPSAHTVDPEKVAGTISEALLSHFRNGCDLIHVHNPLLAKNIYFMDILQRLQEKGYKLFLQIHDFAEDGRPSAFFDEPYPANCHYGVINSRDYNILLESGLKPEGLHLLPNAVNPIRVPPSDVHAKNRHKKRLLYPVRAIRRKNIGEAILLSLFFNRKTLSITLPPNSPPDVKSYLGWKEFVKENGLPVEFDVGLKFDFHHLVASSDLFLTTSIMEGFGFSFLESWTGNKMLWGRILPEICSDFKNNGIRLEHLYQRLQVPVSWLESDALIETFVSRFTSHSDIFHLSVDQNKIRAYFIDTIRSGLIDMGLLNEYFQKKIISYVLSSKDNKRCLVDLNPYLTHPGRVDNESRLLSNNKSAVLKKYNIDVYQSTLINIYKKVIHNTVEHKIDKHILASRFLKPETFSLLKWGDDAG